MDLMIYKLLLTVLMRVCALEKHNCLIDYENKLCRNDKLSAQHSWPDGNCLTEDREKLVTYCDTEYLKCLKVEAQP